MMCIYCCASFQSNHRGNDPDVPELFLGVIFAQPCCTCTVAIRLLFILLLGSGVGGDDLKHFVSLLSSSQTWSRWADLPWWEAQEWTRCCLRYIIYVVFTSSAALPPRWRSSAHCHTCTFFNLKTGALWGHKGKHWTNICLPLRIFLHIRLYCFNLLCFVTNNKEFCWHC